MNEMKMQQMIVIHSASQWSMADETTGEVRRGTTLWYTFDQSQSINDDGSCGNVPAKITMPFEYLREIQGRGGAPIRAIATMVMRTKANKPTLEITEIDYNVPDAPQEEKKK